MRWVSSERIDSPLSGALSFSIRLRRSSLGTMSAGKSGCADHGRSASITCARRSLSASESTLRSARNTRCWASEGDGPSLPSSTAPMSIPRCSQACASLAEPMGASSTSCCSTPQSAMVSASPLMASTPGSEASSVAAAESLPSSRMRCTSERTLSEGVLGELGAVEITGIDGASLSWATEGIEGREVARSSAGYDAPGTPQETSSATAPVSASRTASIEAGRSAGSLASIAPTSASRREPASSGREAETSGGATVACFTASSSIELAAKGREPVSISKAITPRA